MAPIRRYLRITKYSVLECRIYVENPALAHSWLLNSRNPVLPKVIESVRPLVLPKLREEKERTLSRNKSNKKKGIKDVVIHDDFEVSVFLTETTTRHSLLTKHKHFRDKPANKLTSNSNRLIDETNGTPVDLERDAASEPILLREESDEEADKALESIPTRDEAVEDRVRRPKRQRSAARGGDNGEEKDGGEEELFMPSAEEDSEDQSDSSAIEVGSDTAGDSPPAKRQRTLQKQPDAEAGEGDGDDKKKLAMDLSFEGFAIYGRVLCLVVKKRESSARPAGSGKAAGAGVGTAGGNKPGGQAMMENWISSTQMPNPGAEEDVS